MVNYSFGLVKYEKEGKVQNADCRTGSAELKMTPDISAVKFTYRRDARLPEFTQFVNGGQAEIAEENYFINTNFLV